MMVEEAGAMSENIFQSSDLANNRTEVLEAARQGCARVRDKDGTSLVMLRESKLQVLEDLASWSAKHLRLEELINKGVAPTVGDLGELAWLRVFDQEELKDFRDELHQALIASYADRTSDALDECVAAWRVTAQQLDDPLRRSVLRGSLSAQDLVEVDRPDGK